MVKRDNDMALNLNSTTSNQSTALPTDTSLRHSPPTNGLRRPDPIGFSATPSTGSSSGALRGVGDQTTVSAAGGAIAQHLQGSDVRADKVAALQQAISSGTYNIPAGAVADKILSNLLGE